MIQGALENVDVMIEDAPRKKPTLVTLETMCPNHSQGTIYIVMEIGQGPMRIYDLALATFSGPTPRLTIFFSSNFLLVLAISMNYDE